MEISEYYKQERQEIVNLLKSDEQLKLTKIRKLKEEIILNWEKFLSSKQNIKNLRRKILRQRILLRTLQNIKTINYGK